MSSEDGSMLAQGRSSGCSLCMGSLSLTFCNRALMFGDGKKDDKLAINNVATAITMRDRRVERLWPSPRDCGHRGRS